MSDAGSGRGQGAVSRDDCPTGQAIELVAHKWTVSILYALHEAGGPVRFRDLQRRSAPITQKELTKRLRDLERSGLVARRVFAEVPPRVEYRLDDLGQTLIPALEALEDWARRHGPAVAARRLAMAEAAAAAPGESRPPLPGGRPSIQ